MVFQPRVYQPLRVCGILSKKPTNEKFVAKFASPLDKFQEPMHWEKLTTTVPRYALLFLDNIIPTNNQYNHDQY